VAAVAANVYITGLNQLTDVAIDRVNKPQLPLPAGDLTPRTAAAAALGCGAVSVAMALRSPSAWLRAVLLGSAAIGTAYSARPVRLKRWPTTAAVCIVVVRGAVVNLGFYSHFRGALDPRAKAAAAFFAAFGLVIALMKDVPDIDGDAAADIRTLSVRVGPRRALDASVALLQATLLAAAAALATKSASPFRYPLAAAAVAVGAAAAAAAQDVDPDVKGDVAAYYMKLWGVFYGCYAALPLI